MNIIIAVILVASLLVVHALGIWLLAKGSSKAQRILSLIVIICLAVSPSIIALRAIGFFNMLGLHNPIYAYDHDFTVINISAVIAIWALISVLYLAVANAPKLGGALTVLQEIADGVKELLIRSPEK